MAAPDTADSAESPPAKSPTIKLSSAESSPTKPFPTRDLIPVTSQIMDHVSNTHVVWLSELLDNNAGWRELGYKRYYDYLRIIDSSGWVREMIKQYNTMQKNMDCATKNLGEYWQHSPKLLEILNEGNSSEKWL
ncbi:hypothetical protein K440DRAFT_643633 [Wilcoxina mikolae CBS 423.85]|nr:hypothetical protein K440DRAFT_643633 [Wilcoxina mikolae CBS 423.85]